jgi:membrane-bound serine protease (ClpP class)
MNLADTFWTLVTNPNVAYVLLVVGLWSAVLAAIVPGTGLAEAAAVVFLGLAAIGLIRLPFNWAALLLIGLAVALFLLELKLTTHGAFLLGGVVAFALGSLLLFRSGEGEPELMVSRWLVAGTTLATLAFFGFALRRAMAAMRLPPAHNPNAVIGATGEARTPIDGSGSVYVGGELWSARADEAIAAGDRVVVTGRDGLTLKVTKAKS